MSFYYNQQTIHFTAGWDVALMDGYQYSMRDQAIRTGNDVLVPLEDLVRIYAPQMSLDMDGAGVMLTMNDRHVRLIPGSNQVTVNQSTFYLVTCCEVRDNVFYVPAGQVMHFCFGKTVRSSDDMSPTYISEEAKLTYSTGGVWPREDTVVAVSEKADYQLDTVIFRYIDLLRRGKKFGEQYNTYWMEKIHKVLPYITYIPTTYDPSKPTRLVVFLHGGSYNLGEKYAFHFANNKLQKACEKYNFILLCPNAGTMLNRYGQLSERERKTMTQEELDYFQVGDDSVMKAIAQVKETYNIDVSKIFLMGNSMGAGGTFYLATVHSGMFRALCPGAGSLVLMCPENLEALAEMPIIFPMGTEDDFGFDHLLATRQKLEEIGAQVQPAVVGGGRHLDAWVDVIDDIFAFFDRQK